MVYEGYVCVYQLFPLVDSFVLFLTGCDPATTSGSFLVYSPNQSLVKPILQICITGLKGKGGGKGVRVQGKAENITKETIAQVEKEIQNLL